MLRKFVPVLGLLAVPAIAAAQFEAGDLSLTLAGGGFADKGLQQQGYGVTAELGYFTTRELSVGIRQGFDYARLDEVPVGGDRYSFGGSTFGFVNYHFDLGAWQPFVGAFAGIDYATGETMATLVGPEVGVKYFVNATTFVYANLSYAYFTNDPSFSSWGSRVGVGFRF